MALTKLRSRSSFPKLLISFLNLILLFASSASIVAIFLLRKPPTSLGWAFLLVSLLSLLSSFLGFYSLLAHCCFVSHTSILLTSSIGEGFGFLMLFLRENLSLRLLDSERNGRETRVLVKIEGALFLGMFVLQICVLVIICTVQRCWIAEYEGLEAQREETARRRSRKMARVQEESLANAVKIAETRANELDEKMKSKYGQLMKPNHQG